jgi:hypothetical protein
MPFTSEFGEGHEVFFNKQQKKIPKSKRLQDPYKDPCPSNKFEESHAFTAEFGKVNYYIIIAGTYFAVILSLTFIAEMIGKIYKGFEINRLTDNTMGAGKLILASLFNVLYITAMDKQFVKKKPTNNNNNDANNPNSGKLASFRT